MNALNKKHARLTRALQGYFIGLASAVEDKEDTEWYADRTDLVRWAMTRQLFQNG